MAERKPLYPDYRPIGIRKGWEHSSMDCAGAGSLLRGRHAPASLGDPIEAVAWFGARGELRVLVADYANGRRAELRRIATGYRISFVTVRHA